MKNRTNYLIKNTLLFAISSFGSKIISFLLVPLYTNVLTKADYGVADLLSTTVSILLFVFSINISAGVMRFTIDSKENPLGYLRLGLRVFLFGFALMSFVMYLVLQRGWIGLHSDSYIYLLGMYFFTGLQELLSNYYRGRDKIWLIVIAGLSTTLITVCCNILFLVVLETGFVGYLLSIIFGQIVACIIYISIGKPYLEDSNPLSIAQKKAVYLYSLPLVFNGIAWWINQSLDKYFIVSILSVDDNGIYAASSKIPTILSVFLSVFIQAWNLSAIKEYKSKDSLEFYSVTNNVVRSVLSLAVSFLIILNIPISSVLFAKDFCVAWQYSSVLLFSSLFSGMSSVLGGIVSATKKNGILAISTVVAAGGNVILDYLLIPRFGIQGATIATAFSFFVIWIIRYVFVKRMLNLKGSFLTEALVYMLLIVQIIIEHMTTHMYPLQVLIFILIMLISRKEIGTIVVMIKKALRSVFVHE